MPGKSFNILFFLIAAALLLPSCFLSNRNSLEQIASYRGINRVAIFLRRWPGYAQLPNQNNLGADFIKKETRFYGPWEPGRPIDSRAVDVADIDDNQVRELLLGVLTRKGYEPILAGAEPAQAAASVTVAELMARYQALDAAVDAFLFCYYSPVAYVSASQATPPEHWQRSYSLSEFIKHLNPGRDYVIWAGPRAARAPQNSIDHAFIYLSMTMFKALDWRPLWEVADSQQGGRIRVGLARCPPGPTNENYPASAAIIQRLMEHNLECRLTHLIPDAF